MKNFENITFYRIFFNLISLFILGWCFLWNVNIFKEAHIFALILLIFYAYLYYKYGSNYTINIIFGNIFISLLSYAIPSIYIGLTIGTKINPSFEEQLIIYSVGAMVVIFVFSFIWGAFISFIPKRINVDTKITLKIRIKFFIISFVLTYLSFLLLHIIIN